MRWIYEINKDNSVRFALGQIFNPSGKTLLCFGINPSTACPESIDNGKERNNAAQSGKKELRGAQQR